LELLDIKLHDISRLQYANLESRKIWSKKINKASRDSKRIKFNNLKSGKIKCLLWEVNYDKLDNVMKDLLFLGYVVTPLNDIDFLIKKKFKVLIANQENSIKFLNALEKQDFETLSQLTNIPKCCIKFNIDNIKYSDDLIWFQAKNSLNSDLKKKEAIFEGKIDKHFIRLKYGTEEYKIYSTFEKLGIGILNYRPCSFSCKESLIVANDYINNAKQDNVDVDNILDILKLPFEWDCLKGIANINTPVFKLVINSVTCYPNYVVQRESDYYPEEAPNGIKFPWRFPWENK
jgi:hypothetical protein